MPYPLYRSRPNLAGNSRPMVSAYTPNLIWIRLLFNLPGTKPHNFGQISTCWGLLYQAPFNDDSQILYSRADPWSDPWSTLTRQMSSRSVRSVAHWRRKKTQILPFFGLRNFVVSPVGGNRKTLNRGAQLQTIAYPTVSKSFLYSNAFMAKSCAQTLTF